MTNSNKISVYATDVAASTTTNSNIIRVLATELFPSDTTNSNSIQITSFYVPRATGAGTVYQGQAKLLRQSGAGTVYQGVANLLRQSGTGTVFQGTADALEGPQVIPYVKDTANGGIGRAALETDNVIIAQLQRATAGTVNLYADANTTNINIGGGASQGTITLSKSGAATKVNGWLNVGAATAAVADGDLAVGDGTRELFWNGTAGTLNLTTGNGALNVGSGVTPSTANGDIRAGNGSTEVAWTASSGELIASRTDNSQAAVRAHVGTGTLSRSALVVQTNGDRFGSMIAYSSGYSQVAVTDFANSTEIQTSLSQTNGLSLRTTAAAPIRFATSNTLRWNFNSAGHLITEAATSYDIGTTTAAQQPRDLHLNRALNVGNGITPSANNGDIVAGNGSNSLTYVASTGTLTVDDVVADGLRKVLATVGSIDGTAVGTTNIYTVPSGKTAIIEKVIVRVTAATAAVGDAVAGVGIATGEDDIISAQLLTNLTTVDDGFVLTPTVGRFRIADAAEVVRLGIDTGDTGTAVTYSVDVIGYLI